MTFMTQYIRDTIELVVANAAAKSAIILWGDPGTGKTAFVQALGEHLNRRVFIINGASREPSDFLGNPATGETKQGNKVTEIYKPSWFVDIVENPDKPSIWFPDELTSATASTQAAMLSVIQDFMIDGIPFPDDTIIISAANEDDIAADGTMLSAPMANRLCHIKWDPPLEDFIDGLITDWGKGAAPEEVDMRSKVASFLYLHQELIHDMPDNDIDRAQAWPSRRTWDKATRALCHTSSLPLQQRILKGWVGDAAASQFFTWMEESYDIPDPDEILIDADYPNWSDYDNPYVYRVVMSCFSAFSSNMEKYDEGFCDLLVNLADTAHRDVGASMVSRFMRARQPIAGDSGSRVLTKLFEPYKDMVSEAGI